MDTSKQNLGQHRDNFFYYQCPRKIDVFCIYLSLFSSVKIFFFGAAEHFLELLAYSNSLLALSLRTQAWYREHLYFYRLLGTVIFSVPAGFAVKGVSTVGWSGDVFPLFPIEQYKGIILTAAAKSYVELLICSCYPPAVTFSHLTLWF